MRAYFALTAAAFLVLSVSGAAMSWDGSYHFFSTLDSQSLFVPLNRLILLVPESAVLVISRLTDRVEILQFVFGASWAAIALSALGTSWWIVRDIAPGLFGWVIYAVGLGTLSGQFPFNNEATIVVQLSWPVTLAVLTGIQPRHVPVVVLYSVGMLLAHPFSIPLLGIAAGLALVLGLRYPYRRNWMWLWALGFGLLAAVAGLRFASAIDVYEADRMSLDIIFATFDAAVAGLPLIAMGSAFAAACLTLIAPIVKRRNMRLMTYSVYSLEFLLILLAGGLLVIRASQPGLWASSFEFRSWTLFCTLPYIGLSLIETAMHSSSAWFALKTEMPHRARTGLVVGATFLLVLSVQSAVWVQLNSKLRSTITSSPTACLPDTAMSWLQHSPLDHWTITSKSLILQGRVISKIVLLGNGCGSEDLTRGFPLAEHANGTHWRSWNDGWFDVRNLARGMTTER